MQETNSAQGDASDQVVDDAPVEAAPVGAAPPPPPTRSNGGNGSNALLVGFGATVAAVVLGLALFFVVFKEDDEPTTAQGDAAPVTTAIDTETTAPVTETTTLPVDELDLTDDSGAIRVRVPALWADQDGAPTAIGPNLVAAPDVTAFNQSYEAPGVSIQATRQLDATRLDARMDEIELSLGAACTPGVRDTYSDAAYAGYRQRFGCGSAELVLVVVAPADASFAVELVVQVLTEEDEAALATILDSFIVDGALVP